MAEEMRVCQGCGRQISAAYNVCPNCGRPQNAPPTFVPPQAYGPQPINGPLPVAEINGPRPVAVPLGGILTFLMYLISLLFFPFGLSVGIIWVGLGVDREKQHIGKNCLILGMIGIVIGIILFILILGAIGRNVNGLYF